MFDIGGNKYRLVVKMMYKWGRVLIRHVLTHAAAFRTHLRARHGPSENHTHERRIE